MLELDYVVCSLHYLPYLQGSHCSLCQRHLKIGVDVDGVLARFGEGFWSLLNEVHGTNIPFQEYDDWDNWPP